MTATPTPDIPWWVTLLIIPAAVALWAFLEKQVWPYLTKSWTHEDTAEETAAKEERQWRRDLEERRVKAQETTAQAMEQIGKTLAVMQFQIAQIERHIGLTSGEKVRARERVEGA
jgi:hypothetical protein